MASLNDQIIAELECKVCLQYMRPPIRQCSVGHSLCNNCFLRVENCPLCRARLTASRCSALERIFDRLRFPCIHASKGCKQMILGRDLLDHERQGCPVAWLPCLIKRSWGCTWIGPEKDFFEHCFTVHRQNVCEFSTVFLDNIFENREVPDGSVVHHLIKHASKTFISAWKIDREMKMLHYTVFYLGPPEEAQSYHYQLIVCRWSEAGCMPVEIKFPCQPIKDNYLLKQDWENSVPLHYEMMKKYFTQNGLEFHISIQHIDS